MTNKRDFINRVNKLRKSGEWYSYEGEIEGRDVRLMGFGTWLKVFMVDDVNYSNCMERKASEFKKDLEAPFN